MPPAHTFRLYFDRSRPQSTTRRTINSDICKSFVIVHVDWRNPNRAVRCGVKVESAM